MVGMSDPQNPQLDQQTAADLSIAAARVFQPRSPISTQEFFAGRWEQLTTVSDAVAQTGLHIIIFGERGVGKTSLANIIGPLLRVMEQSLTGGVPVPRLVVKVNAHQGDSFANVWTRVFKEVTWVENRPIIGLTPSANATRVTLVDAFSISGNPNIDEVRRVLSALPRSVIIFDEFDRGSAALRVSFTDLIKSLSDYAVDSTIVIVGVSDTIDHLVRDHASIVRAVVQVQLNRMKERELEDILEKGGKALGVTFDKDASSLIVRMSQGLPHYTHLIGLHSCRQAVDRLSRVVSAQDVYMSFQKAVRQAEQSIREKYLTAIHSAHKDALYEKVILASAVASSAAKDELGYFHPSDMIEAMGVILDRPNVTIATFQKHINEFCEKERGPVLERHGAPRAYKYRFHDPLMPPFIFMTAFSRKTIDGKQLHDLTGPH